MTYCLQSLGACSRLSARPHYIPKARLRGTKALGIRFERRVGKILESILPNVHSGVWFEYHDAKRSGVCCIDHYSVLVDRIILVECKLSEREAAWTQMRDLYAPILERQYGLPVARVQAVRHLRTGEKLISDVRLVRPGEERLWHLLI